MNKKPHILFLFSDTGGGHRSAAEAIIEALNSYFPGRVKTEMLDFFSEYAPPPFNKAAKIYAPMAKVPDLWELLYKFSNGKHRSKWVQDVFWPYVRKSAADLIEDHPCDLFVSVHPAINTPLLRILGSEHKPFVIVITDLVSTHAYWYNPDASLTITPTEEAKQRGLALGLSPESLVVIGQPIADAYRRSSISKENLRDKLGWPQDLPVVLLIGGGDGMGPIREMARAVDKVGRNLMMVLVAGRNQSLRSDLENENFSTLTKIYGFVDDLPDFMKAADILLTKAGPGTISEAFVVGLPMILYSRMPGQEEGNVDYVVKNGAGVWVPEPAEVVKTLRRWLNHPEVLAEIRENSQSLARPNASLDIAKKLIEIVTKS